MRYLFHAPVPAVDAPRPAGGIFPGLALAIALLATTLVMLVVACLPGVAALDPTPPAADAVVVAH